MKDETKTDGAKMRTEIRKLTSKKQNNSGDFTLSSHHHQVWDRRLGCGVWVMQEKPEEWKSEAKPKEMETNVEMEEWKTRATMQDSRSKSEPEDQITKAKLGDRNTEVEPVGLRQEWKTQVKLEDHSMRQSHGPEGHGGAGVAELLGSNSEDHAGSDWPGEHGRVGEARGLRSLGTGWKQGVLDLEGTSRGGRARELDRTKETIKLDRTGGEGRTSEVGKRVGGITPAFTDSGGWRWLRIRGGGGLGSNLGPPLI